MSALGIGCRALALSAGVLALVVWWRWPVVTEPSPQQPPLAAEATDPEVPSPANFAPLGAPPNAALLDGREVEPPRSLAARVRGRLVWENSGTAIVGATVRAWRSWRESVVGAELAFVGEARVPTNRSDVFVGEPAITDGSGRFELAGVTEVDGPLSLLVLRDGVRLEAQPLHPGPRPGETLDVGDWLLAPRAILVGDVYDEGGSPIVGARVRFVDTPPHQGPGLRPIGRTTRAVFARQLEPLGLLWDLGGLVAANAVGELPVRWPETRTDAVGGFRLHDARPGVGTLVVLAPTAPPVTLQVLARAGETLDLGRIRLRAGDLRGRVLDRGDRPVAGAEVILLPFDGVASMAPVVTDPDGRFTFARSDGAPVAAAVRAAPSMPWGWTGVYPVDDHFVVRSPGTAPVTVTLTDPKRAVATGARVEFRFQRTFDSGYDGIAPLREIRPGVYQGDRPLATEVVLVARAAGFAPLVAGAPAEDASLQFTQPTFSATFAIRDARGRAVSGAKLYARLLADDQSPPSHEWGALRRWFACLGETDARGSLRCDGLWDAPLEVVAAHPDVGVAERIWLRLRADQPPCELTLVAAPRGRVVGRLTERGQATRSRWLVWASGDAPTPRPMCLSAPDGSFALPRLPPGEWLIHGTRVEPAGMDALKSGLGIGGWAVGWRQRLGSVNVAAGIEHRLDADVRPPAEPPWVEREYCKVRIDGVPVAGLTLRATGNLATWRREHEDAERFLANLRHDRLAGSDRDHAFSELRTRRTALVNADFEDYVYLADSDAAGAFRVSRFMSLSSRERDGKSAFELVAFREGFEQRLWAGRLEPDATIDLTTGQVRLEVRDGGQLPVAHRVFVVSGLGAIDGVRVVAATDRTGAFTLTSVPCGEYGLRMLATGIDVDYPSPAFRVTGPEMTREVVVAR